MGTAVKKPLFCALWLKALSNFLIITRSEENAEDNEISNQAFFVDWGFGNTSLFAAYSGKQFLY
jgi:hypothetical protein